MPGYVYLLHFDRRMERGRRPWHYVGSTDDLSRRIERHRQGLGPREGGARFTQVMWEQGIGFDVAKVWTFEDVKTAREFERRLKRQRHHPRHCPHCQAARAPQLEQDDRLTQLRESEAA